MKKSIERILYTAIFTGALLSMQNNLAYAKPGDVYDLSTGFKFTKEHVTNNNSVVSFLEEKIQKGDKIVKELPDSKFIYVEGFKKDYQRYLKEGLEQEDALIKAIDNNLIINQEELDKIKNSKDFFAQDTSLAIDVNGDIVRVAGNTLDGKALINVYDTSNKEVYIGYADSNEIGIYEYIFDFQGNTTGNYKIVVQDSILGNKQESNIEYKEQEIKEIPKLEDVSINYGDKYELPKTIEILTQDKDTSQGNNIKNVMVVWDKELDSAKPGKQEFSGKLLNVTTNQGIQLNVIVGEQDPKEAVNERFKKLDDLMKQDINFVGEETNIEINNLLNSVQEALNNQNLKDEEFKKTMKNKVDVHANKINKINNLKVDIESFEDLLLNGDFTDKAVNDEYNSYYDKLVNIYNDFNKATYTSVRERKETAENWYVKNNYEFGTIKGKVLSDLYVLHRDMTYLTPNQNQERYNKIEEFRTICTNIGDLSKYKFNKSTTEALKNMQNNLLDKVETIILDNGGVKLNKGTGENKIEATLVGIKLNDLGSCRVEILDEDQYGNNVEVSVDGTITLDSDKGNDDNTKYEQLIVVKDSLWNIQHPIKVIITDCQGKDTFEISTENSNKIVELQQFEDVTLTLGDSEYKLPSQVKVRLLDNTENMVNVTWDKELLTDTVGEFNFIGKVEGTTLTTNIKVIVKQFSELELLEYYTGVLESKLGDSINLSNESNLAKSEVALNDAKAALINAGDGEEKENLKARIDKCEALIRAIKSINANIHDLKYKESTLILYNYSHIREYQELYQTIESQLDDGINKTTKDTYLEILKVSKETVRTKIYFSDNVTVTTNEERDSIKFVFAHEEITDLSEYEVKINDKDNYGKKVNIDLSTGKIILDNDLLSDNGKIYIQEISVKDTFWDISKNIYVEIKDVKDGDTIIVTRIKSIENLQDITLNIGEDCKLQNTVMGKDIDDYKVTLNVQWDYSNINTSEEGKYFAIGNIIGTYRTIEVNVNVKKLSLEERLQNKIEKLNRAFGDSVDLTDYNNREIGNSAIKEAEDIIREIEATGIECLEEKLLVDKAKVALLETESVLNEVENLIVYIDTADLSNCRYSEFESGESRIEEINSKYNDIGWKILWPGDKNITDKITVETVDSFKKLLDLINAKHNLIKGNLISELKNMDILNNLLKELKKDPTNADKYDSVVNKLNEPVDYANLNDATINGFKDKRSVIQFEVNNIPKPEEIKIVEILPMSPVSVEVNTDYTLPGTVQVKMSDKTFKNVNVVWMVNGEVKTSVILTEIGQIIAIGTVEGFEGNVELTINVVGEIIETDLEKLNKIIEELKKVFTEDIDLTIVENMVSVENTLNEAKQAISNILDQDVSEQQKEIDKIEVNLKETKETMMMLENFEIGLNSDLSEGIEELSGLEYDLYFKVIDKGNNSIVNKVNKATYDKLYKKVNTLRSVYSSYNESIEGTHPEYRGIRVQVEELETMLSDLKKEANEENYNKFNIKYEEVKNLDYSKLNNATTSGFQNKINQMKIEADLSMGIPSTTSSAITVKLDEIKNQKQSNDGQAKTNPNKSEVYARKEDVLGLKRTVISSVEEFIKRISRKFK